MTNEEYLPRRIAIAEVFIERLSAILKDNLPQEYAELLEATELKTKECQDILEDEYDTESAR